MSLSINIGRPFLNDKTLDEQARSVLRLYGTDAHVYLPGANGVAVSGLPTNNYPLSDGSTGYSAVDGTAGLVLDGAGSVGGEQWNNGTALVAGESTQVSSGVYRIYSSAGAYTDTHAVATATVGATYIATFTIDSVTVAGGGISVDAVGVSTFTTTGQKQCIFVASTSQFAIKRAGGAVDIQISNVSFKQVTGIHVTQATTANKPALRRGLYNLLTYSQDFTQAVWAVQATCTKGASGLFNLPAVNDSFLQTHTATYGAGTALTAAYELSGSGTVTVEIYRNDAGTPEGYQQSITLSTTPTIFVAPFTFTASHTSYRARVIRLAGDTATAVTISKAGLFQGTLTAAQILAEGGIPVTTSTAASNPIAGRYWLGFNGTTNSLALGSVPFQMSDDHCVIAAFSVTSATAEQAIFSVASTSNATPYVCYLRVVSGVIACGWRDEASTTRLISGGTITAGTTYVVAAAKIGGTYYLWLNGVLIGSGATTFGTSTVDTSNIGALVRTTTSNYFNGAIYSVMPLKGTFTEADVLTIERLVAANAPNGPTF